MPESATVGAFVLGSILLLLALVGGQFKVFGAEVSNSVGPAARVVAGLAGAALLLFGLYPKPETGQTVQQTLAEGLRPPASGTAADRSTAQVSPAEARITLTYHLDEMVDADAVVYIDGRQAGAFHVDENERQATLAYALPRPGSYPYSIQARMTLRDITGMAHLVESSGRGTIEVEAGKRFLIYTQNINLGADVSRRFYADLRDRDLEQNGK